MSLKEIPVVGSLAAAVVDLMMFGGDIFVSFLLSLGDVIPILSLASAYVAPQLEWLSSSAVSTALFVSALLYIGVSIARLLGGGGNDE
jgi:hypothetical protein